MSGIVDAQERARALDNNTSFAVTAPAGSGKTELLIQRCLTLLASVDKPEEILAITFTRKAANEMRDRILEALRNGLNDQEPNESHKRHTWTLARAVLAQDKRCEWELLNNPNRLRIQTIDSFCMHLVQRMPLMSRLGSEARVSDEPLEQYRQAARQLLARLEEPSTVSEDLKRLLLHLDNNTARIEALFCSILSKREQWLRHFISAKQEDFNFRSYLENCLSELVEESLQAGSQSLRMYESQLMQSVDFACTQLKTLAPDAMLLQCAELTSLPGSTESSLPQWQALCDLLLTKDGRFRATLTKNQGFPSSTKKDEKAYFKAAKDECLELINDLKAVPGLLSQLQDISQLPAPHYSSQQWQLLDTLTRLLPTLVAELTLVFMEQGALDYAQVSSAASVALGDDDQPSDIALLLDYQLKHILVDEFQDTSTPQFNLLSRLTDGWEPGDGRTLFIVGDGMQSCYGFREANVGLFLAAREFGIGNAPLEPLDLKANFRSDAGVVDWVNNSFLHAFPAMDNIARGAVAYSSSVAVQPGEQPQPVAFYGCIEDEGRRLEAEKVVELVTEISQQHPEDSIAILVRNRSHLKEIMPSMRQTGIEWQAVDIDPLAERPLISDLMSLTRALLNPADRIAWLAILRAPWCGLSLSDLHQIAASDRGYRGTPPSIWSRINDSRVVGKLSENGEKLLNRLLLKLKPLISQRQRKPLKQWIEGAWLSLGGPLTASSSQELAQAPAFFELLTRFDAGSFIADFDAFQEAVAKLFAKPANNPAIRLQIMTIHKSKGLEFDHVILPGLERGNPSRNQELLLWHERLSNAGEPLLLMGSLPRKGGEKDALYEYLKREHRLKEQLENTRLLYVGATRAVKQLRLLANVSRRDENSDDMKPPSENSLLHSLWPHIKDQLTLVDNKTTIAAQQNEPRRPAYLPRLPVDWQAPDFPRGELLATYRGHEYRGNDFTFDDAVIDNQQLRANCLKKLLMAVCHKGADYWSLAGSDALRGLVEQQLSIAGLFAEPELVTELERHLTTALHDPKGQWLLANTHHDARTGWLLNEQVMAGETSTILQHPIDRSFVDDGRHWLISFAPPTDSTDPASDVSETALRAAARALAQHSNLPVSAACYFLNEDSATFIELS